MNINDVNKRIENEFDEHIYNLLKDENLNNIYKESKSVQDKINSLSEIFNKYEIDKIKQNSIINDIIDISIPAGTKGVIKGNFFNHLIKKEIENYNLPIDKFNICFEKKNPNYDTNEIPDWFIEDKKTNKIIIGLNQIDLWSGGAQLNRGSKYILNEINSNSNANVKFLCVVASKPKLFKNEKSKCFKIIKKGFEHDSLCFIKNLKNIIYNFFECSEIGLKRNPIDKFYTKPMIAKKCIEHVISQIIIDKEKDLIIEPSAGNGSFIPFIKNIVKNFLFLDISPNSDEIIKQDFLSFILNEKKFNKIHIIGNPPFGRQSSMAFKFLKKAMEFADSVSFILPKSFRKQSNQEKINLYFHLSFEIDICDNSFLINNVEYNVPCIFQIWIRKENPRIKLEKLQPTFFKFVKKNENPDISFRRVGINAGNISTNIIDKSEESHYFIKFINNDDLNTNLQKFQINYVFNNHTGPRSISKQELLLYLKNKDDIHN